MVGVGVKTRSAWTSTAGDLPDNRQQQQGRVGGGSGGVGVILVPTFGKRRRQRLANLVSRHVYSSR